MNRKVTAGSLLVLCLLGRVLHAQQPAPAALPVGATGTSVN